MLEKDQIVYRLPRDIDILPVLIKPDGATNYFGFIVQSDISSLIRLDLNDDSEEYLCNNCKYGYEYIKLFSGKKEEIHLNSLNEFISILNENVNTIPLDTNELTVRKVLRTLDKKIYCDDNNNFYLPVAEDRYVRLNDIIKLEGIKDTIYFSNNGDIADYIYLVCKYPEYYFSLEKSLIDESLRQKITEIINKYENELMISTDLLKQMEEDGLICRKHIYDVDESCLLKESKLPLESNLLVPPLKGLDKALNTLRLVRNINIKDYCFIKKLSPKDNTCKSRLYLRVEDKLKNIDSGDLRYDDSICWGLTPVDNMLDLNEVVINYINLPFQLCPSIKLLFKVNNEYDFINIEGNMHESLIKNYKGERNIFDLKDNLYDDNYKAYGFLVSLKNMKVDLIYKDENTFFTLSN